MKYEFYQKLKKGFKKKSPFFLTLIGASLFFLFWFYYLNQKEPSSFSKSFEVLHQMKEKGAPVFVLPDLFSEKEILSKEFESEIFLVHFWASWCEPCIKEIPSLLKLAEVFKDSVTVFGISLDKNKEEAKLFVEPLKKETLGRLKWLWDPKAQVALKYGYRALPETYILDSEKKLIRKVVGSLSWDSGDSISYFKMLIQKN